ncbi:MAG: alpha/beta fold hydrolase [Syntrophales bacterium]
MTETSDRGPFPEVRRATIQGTGLDYLHYEGSGPDVVMLHATGFLPWLWHPIARGLAPACRVVAPYFCDHRPAEPDEGGLSWETLAEDLTDFCGQLHLDRPYMVGHSMGATVITIAAAVCGLVPRGLVLIEPIFLPENIYEMNMRVEDHPLASKSIKRRNGWHDAAEVKSYLRSRKMFETWEEEMLDLYVRYGFLESDAGGLQLACSPRREAALFMGGIRVNPWPFLEKVSCPVLVIEGEKSENRAFINLKEASSHFPKGSYRLVEGAGHLIPMERPDEIETMIHQCLGLKTS